MITSFVDGRVRIRAAALKKPDKMAMVEQLVKAQEGVVDTRANPLTGSLLITYDPEKISRETLETAAEALRSELGMAPPAAADPESCAWPAFFPKISGNTELTLLSTAALGTLAGLFFGRRLHAIAGSALVALTARHVYCRRQHFKGSLAPLSRALRVPRHQAGTVSETASPAAQPEKKGPAAQPGAARPAGQRAKTKKTAKPAGAKSDPA